jgi:hypothetical protein
MTLDFGQGPRHIPVDTARVGERDLLVAIAQLLTEQLAATKHLLAAFERLSVNGESGAEERLPSISVEDMAKGEPKVVTKSYDGRPLTRSLIDEHLAAHAYAKRLANELQMRQWSDTAAMVANGERP